MNSTTLEICHIERGKSMSATKKKSKVPTFHFLRLSFVGILGALFFLHISLLPSLLPRPWLLQGFVSGISMAIGYGFGLAFSASFRFFIQKEISADKKAVAWKILSITGPLIAVISLAAIAHLHLM